MLTLKLNNCFYNQRCPYNYKRFLSQQLLTNSNGSVIVHFINATIKKVSDK